MTKPPSEWIPEAYRFIDAFDQRKTFEQFWDEYLTLFGVENPEVRQVGDDPQELAALKELWLALDPFTACRQGKRDTDVIDPDR